MPMPPLRAGANTFRNLASSAFLMADNAATEEAKEAVREASAKCASTDAEAIFEEETHGMPTAPLNLQLLPVRHTKVYIPGLHGT